MARWELRDRKPGMMTWISLAVSVATLIWDLGEDFFWELVTLIDIMLLGHWMEMRSRANQRLNSWPIKQPLGSSMPPYQ